MQVQHQIRITAHFNGSSRSSSSLGIFYICQSFMRVEAKYEIKANFKRVFFLFAKSLFFVRNLFFLLLFTPSSSSSSQTTPKRGSKNAAQADFIQFFFFSFLSQDIIIFVFKRKHEIIKKELYTSFLYGKKTIFVCNYPKPSFALTRSLNI